MSVGCSVDVVRGSVNYKFQAGSIYRYNPGAVETPNPFTVVGKMTKCNCNDVDSKHTVMLKLRVFVQTNLEQNVAHGSALRRLFELNNSYYVCQNVFCIILNKLCCDFSFIAAASGGPKFEGHGLAKILRE